MKPILWVAPFLVASFLALPISSPAQWMPVVAKQRRLVYEVSPDGSEVLVSERRGTFFRTSSGSVLRTLFTVRDGQTQGKGSSILIDAQTGKTYSLNHKSRTAQVSSYVRQPPLLPTPRDDLRDDHVIGSSTINGVECIALKCYEGGFDADNVVPGKVWVNIAYDLAVKSDCLWFSTRRSVTELYDIEFREPDASVTFSVPEGYTLRSQ